MSVVLNATLSGVNTLIANSRCFHVAFEKTRRVFTYSNSDLTFGFADSNLSITCAFVKSSGRLYLAMSRTASNAIRPYPRPQTRVHRV